MLSETRILRILKLFILIGGGLFFVMAILTSAHVVGRYGFNSPIYGQSELACLIQIIAISMAGAYTLVQKRHVTIGIVVDRLPERTQAVIDFVTHLLSLLFTSLAAWQNIQHATYLLQVRQHTELIRIPVAPFFYMIGVGWGLLSVASIILLIRFASKGVKG